MEKGIVASRGLSQITKLGPPGAGGGAGGQQWTSGKGHSCLQTQNSKGPNSGAWGGAATLERAMTVSLISKTVVPSVN